MNRSIAAIALLSSGIFCAQTASAAPAVHFTSCGVAVAAVRAAGEALVYFPDRTYALLNNGNHAYCSGSSQYLQPYFYGNCLVGNECVEGGSQGGE